MPEAVNPAQELVDGEFPENFRHFVPSALKRAYVAADAAYEQLDFLGTPSGRFQRGDLIVLAAEFEFMRLITDGHLPFDPSWDDYAAPTGKHLVMRTQRAQITINQVEYPRQKPRSARFRDMLAVPNAQYLFPEWNAEREKDDARKHVLLLHGYSKLRFANLSVPHPHRNKIIWCTDNLLKLPHEVTDSASKTEGEGPTESPDAELVEEVVKTVSDIEKTK